MLTKRVRAPSVKLRKSVRASKKARTTYTLTKAVKPNIHGRVYNKRALTYCELGATLNPGSGTAAAYVFSANGLFDPNITGIGHQPVGYDQLMAIYGEYLVTKSTMKVTFWNTNTVPILAGLSIQTFPGVSNDSRVYIENQDCLWVVLEAIGANGGGPTSKTLTMTCDMRQQVRADIFNDQGWSGVAGSNPAYQKYFHLFAQSADGSIVDPNAIGMVVQIDYEVYFREQALNALS